MKFFAQYVALAGLGLLTAGPCYAEPLRSTSIPSSLADDEKRLMPKVMSEFYGTFDKEKHPISIDQKEEKGCWVSTKSGPYPQGAWGVDTENTVIKDIAYCMKPIRLDVIKPAGRKLLLVVAGGNYLDEDGQPQGADPSLGVFGLIVLTPNGANLGVVATNDLYEGYESYGGYPQHDTIAVRKLGPNGAYGWVAKLAYAHSNQEHEWVQVYGVIGNSVTLLAFFETHFSEDYGEETCQEVGGCSTLSAKYTFDTHSSVGPFYPIILQVSGIQKGRPFRGNYRLVFDNKSLKYLRPENVPDEIMPRPASTKP